MNFDFSIDVSAIIQSLILVVLVYYHKSIHKLLTYQELHHWRLSQIEKKLKLELKDEK